MAFTLLFPAPLRNRLRPAPADVRGRLEAHLGRYVELAGLLGEGDGVWGQLRDPLSNSLRCDVKGWGVLFEVDWARGHLRVTDVAVPRGEDRWGGA